MAARRARTAGGLVLALALTVALAACSTRTPGQDSLETAIPAAFLASDLGVTAAQAGKSNDGLSTNVWVSAQFEADTAGADDLRTMLQLAVDNTDLSGVSRLSIVAAVGPFENRDYIDLGALGVELGFAAEESTTSGFNARWDDVVDFLDE
jgi:hypothetical protein